MKKWIKILSISLILVGTSGQVRAQFGYYNEALLFSRTQYGGSARIQAIGGAQVALGGDVSLAASNPAGLGFFNRNSFTFSPGVDLHSSSSNYFGTNTSNYRNKFVMPQIGLVLNNNRGDALPDDFKGGSFAIALQRTNDFNNYYQYSGVNGSSSIVNSFIANVGALYPDQLTGYDAIAYDHFLIDEADYNTADPFLFNVINGNTYISPNIADGTIEGYESVLGNYYGSIPRQSERIRTSGGQYVLNGSWGGNFKDIFYFGAGLGIHFLNYDRTRNYTETDFQIDGNRDDLINSISIRDRLSIEGSGVNATIGAIARPLPYLTFGISYHTPTYYVLNEESDFTFVTDWSDNAFYVYGSDTIQMGYIATESDIFLTDYSLRTPSRLNMGTAVFLGKNGFISGEVEFVDYRTSQLQSNDFEVIDDNDAIYDSYRDVVNYKLGAEIRFDELRFRGGYNYQADPFRTQDIDRSVVGYSGGIGYRNKDYFIDFSTVYRESRQQYSAYFLPENYAGGTPSVNTKFSSISSMVTVGFTF